MVIFYIIMENKDVLKIHEQFLKKFFEMTYVVDDVIDNCELCGDMSLLYDFFENRTRRCDRQLTEVLGDEWDENFNHFFTGD